MEKEVLKKIFEFLEEKEGQTHKSKGSLRWKLFFNEQLTKEELNVKGNFYLKDTKIESLPKGLEVEHDLYLNGSPITSLPEGLKVGGVLWLFSCESITSLPNDLKVGGGLDLRFTKVTSLPKGLEVDTFLVVSNTKLTKYSDEELREMVKPGFIKGRIIR